MGWRFRGGIGVVALACVLALGWTADASAVTRYAAPGGSTNDTLCTNSNPLVFRCTIYAAAQGPDVVAGDSVVIEPGNYTDTHDAAGDLGPTGVVSPVANTIGGAAGQPRPVITLSNATSTGFTISSGDVLSHLEIDTSVSSKNFDIVSSSGTGQDLIARSTATGGTACGINSGTLRESACLATGAGDTAAGTTGAGGALSVTLRDVTAVASGTGSRGFKFFNAGSSGAATASVLGVIARATGTSSADVFASNNPGSTATINIDYSNYATTAGATIVPGGNNQSGAPALAADGYHELPSSTATIDFGQTDGSSGTTDIDGQNRTVNGFPDIGADELGKATITNVTCSPPSIVLGGTSRCTAAPQDASPPFTTVTGNVAFSSDMAGSFNGGTTCSLNLISHTCFLDYTPSAAGTHTITATYLGDSSHEPSSGTTPLVVTAPPPPPPGDSGGSTTGSATSPTSTPTLKRCKKGRKLKHGRCVKKKRR
jgi:hypothetical protein